MKNKSQAQVYFLAQLSFPPIPLVADNSFAVSCICILQLLFALDLGSSTMLSLPPEDTTEDYCDNDSVNLAEDTQT